MDYTPALQPLFDYRWFLISLIIFYAVINCPWFKGKAGEGVVNLFDKRSRSIPLPSDQELYLNQRSQIYPDRVHHRLPVRRVCGGNEEREGAIFGEATLSCWVKSFVGDYFCLRGLYENI